MTEKQRPDIVGKGPTLAREMMEVFRQIEADAGSLSPAAREKISVRLSDRCAELEKVIKMAYLKTVKAGEVAWDLKEKALELKESAKKGDEARALALTDELDGEVGQFLHKIKTFVVRMT